MELYDIELIKRIKESNGADLEAAAELWDSLRGFFAKYFGHFKNYLRCPDEIDDLIQETYFKIIPTALKYDMAQNISFLTFLNRPLQAVLRDYLAKNGAVSYSMNVFERIQKINRFKRKYEAIQGRCPSADEIAQEVNETPEEVDFLTYVSGYNLTRSIDETIRAPSDADGSMDERTFGDTIPVDDFSDDIIDEIDSEVLSSVLRSYVDEQLHGRQHDIVIGTFFDEMTRSEIKNDLDLTESQYRDAYSTAMKKLRKKREAIRELIEHTYSSYRAYHCGVHYFERHGSAVENIAIALANVEQTAEMP